MTQGFVPGQPTPTMAPQAAYPQQGGYPHPNAARRSGGGSGWAIALGLIGLTPVMFWLVINFIEMTFFRMDLFDTAIFLTFWDENTGVLAWVVYTLCYPLLVAAAVMSMFRSSAGRIMLVVVMAIEFIAGALTIIAEIAFPRPEFYAAIPVLILAFLPPVNQAFRKIAKQPGQLPMNYGYPAMAQQQAAYPQSQPQPVQQQMGYPQQQPMQPQSQPQPQHMQPQQYPQQQPYQQWQ